MKTYPSFLFPAAAAPVLVSMLVVAGCAVEPTPTQESKSPPSQPTNAAAPASATATNAAAADAAPVRIIDPTPPARSAGVNELVKMAESGVGESVLLSFVRNSPVAYDLTPDDILYLNDVGVPESVVTAMIERGRALREQAEAAVKVAVEASRARDAAAEARPAEETRTPAPAPVVASQPPTPELPAPEYVQQSEPAAVAPYPDVPQQVNYYYSTLAPYGGWYDLPGYGWCWRPRVAVIDTSWRPYCHGGRWVYSDYGWYWASSYSWGWAPFHYGNWFYHGSCGWMWSPGAVWAPAWVSWCYTPAYVGWAPLPPGAGCTSVGVTWNGSAVGVGFSFGLGAFHYSFVKYQNLCDRKAYQSTLPVAQAQSVYARGNVINNIIVGNNNTIINRGVSLEQIPVTARSEIRKATVRDMPVASVAQLKGDRVERQGNDLVVYRPQLTSIPSSGSAARTSQELTKTSARAGVAAPAAAVNPLPPDSTASARGTATSATAATTPSLGLKQAVGRAAAPPPQPLVASQAAPTAERSEVPKASGSPAIRELQPVTASRPATAVAEPIKAKPEPVIARHETAPVTPRSAIRPQTTPSSVPVAKPAPDPTRVPGSPNLSAQPVATGKPQLAPRVGQPASVSDTAAATPSIPSAANPPVRSSAPTITPPVRQEAVKSLPAAPTYAQPSLARPSAPSSYRGSPMPSAQPALPRPTTATVPNYQPRVAGPSYSAPAPQTPRQNQYQQPASPSYRPAPVQAPAPVPAYRPTPPVQSRPATPAPAYRPPPVQMQAPAPAPAYRPAPAPAPAPTPAAMRRDVGNR
jgi:hypothetical protein